MNLLHAIILGIIEGITEFLPISSTGHMVLTSTLLKIQDNEFVKTFEIVIQLGAIMAVVVAYYKRFLLSFKIYLKLAVAVLPCFIVGFLVYKKLKELMGNPIDICISLAVGGILLIIFDKWTDKKEGYILSGCRQDRIIPVHIADTGCFPCSGNNFRRHFQWIQQKAGNRIFLPSCSTHHVCRHRI